MRWKKKFVLGQFVAQPFTIIPGDIFKTGFLKTPVAVFQSGLAFSVKNFEEELKKQGVFALMLMNPTSADLQLLKEEEGFFHGPFWVTWHKTVRSYLEDLLLRDDLTGAQKRKKRAKYEYKIKQAESFQVEAGSLTKDSYLEWYPVYEKYVLNREFSVQIFDENLTEPHGMSRGDLSRWGQIFLRDPATGKIVGGFLLTLYPEEGICKIRGAAFNKSEEYQKQSLSLKVFHELCLFAKAKGFKTLSYGSDPNFFGEVMSLGLQKHKASFGFMPFLFTGSEVEIFRYHRIIKVLNPKFSHATFSFKDESYQQLIANISGALDDQDAVFPWGMEVRRF